MVLEQGPDGQGNWVMGAPKTDEEVAEEEAQAEEDADADEGPDVPLVIRSAQLKNVRLIYGEGKKPERVVQLDNLSITPGRDELLALDGQGKVDVYPLVLKGEMGPLKSLLSATDMRKSQNPT